MEESSCFLSFLFKTDALKNLCDSLSGDLLAGMLVFCRMMIPLSDQQKQKELRRALQR